MRITIDLPDELAHCLNALLPEEGHHHFAISAIADALLALEDTGDYITSVEAGIEDMEAGKSIFLDEEKARRQQLKTTLLEKSHAALHDRGV